MGLAVPPRRLRRRKPPDPSGHGGGGTPPGSPAVCRARRLRRFAPNSAAWSFPQTLQGEHSVGSPALQAETGDGAAPRVSALDVAAARRAMNATVPIGQPADFNRDGRVNALDLAAVRSNLNRVLSPPPALAGESERSDENALHG
jgi:hypothetical protein